jgi:hypothetical protein
MAEPEPGGPDKRRTARAPRQWPVEIRSPSGRTWRGTTIDISTTGMRVRVDRPLPSGDMFLSFDPGDKVGPFWTRFAIVREIVPRTEYAIRFLDLPPLNVERLTRLVAS